METPGFARTSPSPGWSIWARIGQKRVTAARQATRSGCPHSRNQHVVPIHPRLAEKKLQDQDHDRRSQSEDSNTHRFEIKNLANDRLGSCSRAPVPGHRDVTRGRQVNDTLL